MKIKLLFLFFIISSIANSAVYYVSPSGSPDNTGTVDSPFWSPMDAQEVVSAGDTVYIRGGQYDVAESEIARYYSVFAYVYNFTVSGTEGNMINYWAYPGETPVFNFENVNPADYRVYAFTVSASYIHIKGIEIINVMVNITAHTQSICFYNLGSNNIYENCKMHDGMGIGFYLYKGSDNLILNCDAYNIWDSVSETGLGENSDGFGCHPAAGGTGNVFRGCRAWFCADDGYDCISAYEAVTWENCWAFYNGYNSDFETLSNGNGFKSGGYGLTPTRLPTTIPRHVTRRCLSVGNRSNGFYANHHLGGTNWFNNTAYNNPINYNMLSGTYEWDDDLSYYVVTDCEGYDININNNIAYGGSYTYINLNFDECNEGYNTFTMNGVSVSDADFESLDLDELTADRKSNGDLPDISLLHLASSSDLIDAGYNCPSGIEYEGDAPDLGCFEYGAVTTVQYTLTVNSASNGTVTPSSGTYNDGDVIEVTATADDGYVFVSWTGDLTSTESTVFLTMDEDKTISATFRAIENYTVTTDIDGMGVISPAIAGTYEEGTVLEFAALPYIGYKFTAWSGSITSSSINDSLTVDSDKSIIASFTTTDSATVYEFENGYYETGTADFENKNAGYSGQGYVNTANASESWTEITVYAQTAGDYTADVYYAGTSDRPVTVTTDGTVVGNMSGTASDTSDWTVWVSETVTLSLSEGENVLRFTATGDAGAPNLDKLEIYPLKQTQEIDLIEGWNLVSLNVVPSDSFIDSVFPNATEVKTLDEYYNTSQDEFLNTLTDIEAGTGYLVYNSVAETITIIGLETGYTLSLQDGLNLVGCPYSETTSFEEALGTELDSVQIIQSLDGEWTPDGTQTINSFEPGKAYFIMKHP